MRSARTGPAAKNRIRAGGGLNVALVVSISAIVVLVPLVHGMVGVQDALFSSELAVFGSFMGSPIVQLLFPSLAAGLGCTALFAELGTRFVANLRARVDVNEYLMSRLLQSTMVPGMVFGASVLLIAVLCFGIWPALGSPSIDISLYDWTPEEEAASDGIMFGFSQLMNAGTWVYAVWAAIWAAFCAATYGAAAAAALLLVERRAVAILIPAGVYLVETIIAAIAVGPYPGLLYSAFPFSLQQPSPLTTAAPTVILAAAVALVWAWILRHPNRLMSTL